MEVNKLLNNGKNLNLDFSCIREKDEYQSLFSNAKNNRIKYSKVKLIMYTLAVMLISVSSTLLIERLLSYQHTPGSVDIGKMAYLVENEYFDKLISFGPEYMQNLYQEDLILNSNIINEKDKDILRDYLKEQKKLNSGPINAFEIVFAIKDGKDIILIGDVRPAEYGANLFCFESNLSYSFESIINDLEQITNTTITDEFLQATKYEDGKQVMGITLNFNQNADGVNIPYYKVIINDKVYVLNK